MRNGKNTKHHSKCKSMNYENDNKLLEVLEQN